MEDNPLEALALKPLLEASLQVMVEAYWTEGTGWKWEELSGMLPALCLLKLASVVISSREEGKDMLALKSTFTEEFSMKPAYTISGG